MPAPIVASSMYLLSMTKQGKHSTWRLLIILPIFLLCFQNPAHGQAIQFSMDVQPELGIEVLQDLDFGTVVANSGTQQIALGDFGMGIFEIRAFSAQHAFLSIDPPDTLRNEGSNSSNAIPFTMNAAYASRPGNYTDLTYFKDNTAWISLGQSEIGTPTSVPAWQTGYVYIFGEIEVGDITQGSYSGTLILNVTYQ